MDPWCHSDITFQRMEGLVRHGVLRAQTSAEEWLLPGDEDLSSPPDDYVVSFAHFHERGLATPAHKFLRGLLVTPKNFICKLVIKFEHLFDFLCILT